MAAQQMRKGQTPTHCCLRVFLPFACAEIIQKVAPLLNLNFPYDFRACNRKGYFKTTMGCSLLGWARPMCAAINSLKSMMEGSRMGEGRRVFAARAAGNK